MLRVREPGLRPRGEALWLVPSQKYLNVEKDEGRTLEQKRNLLSCLLVRVLKAHGGKGLHIDHLVCLVSRQGTAKLRREPCLGTAAGARGHHKGRSTLRMRPSRVTFLSGVSIPKRTIRPKGEAGHECSPSRQVLNLRGGNRTTVLWNRQYYYHSHSHWTDKKNEA